MGRSANDISIVDVWKLKTINDALKYCQDVVQRYDIEMTPKEKESLASELLGFYASDYFAQWREDYPIVDAIEALASDLSWSNAINIDDDWEKLLAYINELARQVKG